MYIVMHWKWKSLSVNQRDFRVNILMTAYFVMLRCGRDIHNIYHSLMHTLQSMDIACTQMYSTNISNHHAQIKTISITHRSILSMSRQVTYANIYKFYWPRFLKSCGFSNFIFQKQRYIAVTTNTRAHVTPAMIPSVTREDNPPSRADASPFYNHQIHGNHTFINVYSSSHTFKTLSDLTIGLGRNCCFQTIVLV